MIEALIEPAIENVAEKIRVGQESLSKLPDDLYIPPDALRVFLEAFEGPLDLLLYLIRKHNVDILEIPIADITRQYMDYVEVMKAINLELAADYLVMAAILAEIKSRVLLPKPPSEDGEEELDPRAELIRRLQEYERFKLAAERLDTLPQVGREIQRVVVAMPEYKAPLAIPQVDLKELMLAFMDVLKRTDLNAAHEIKKELLSVRERMSLILDKLQTISVLPFHACFNYAEGRMGVVVTFLAMLELMKASIIEIVQSQPFAPIYIKGCQNEQFIQ